MSNGDKIGCLWMTQLLLFGFKKKRSLVNWKVSTILWYKGDYSVFGEAMYLRILKDKNIFIQIHFLLVRWHTFSFCALWVIVSPFVTVDTFCFALQFSYSSVVVSLEQELYLYLSLSSPIFYTISRLNLNVIANLWFHKEVI